MAVISTLSMQGLGPKTAAPTTAGASDTLVFKPGTRQILMINNVSGGAITPNIDGDGGTTKLVAGMGAAIDTSGGYDFASIADGAIVFIDLSTISEFCKGTVTVTGADSAELTILEY